MPNPGSLTCEYCSKKFKQYSRLRVHKQIHTGDKDYKCTLCTYSFNASSALTNHIRSHTKEKPFHCPHPNCSLSVSTKRALNAHGLVHNKTDENVLKFECQVSGCGYKTIRKPQLKAHMRVHSNLKPFACDLCPFRAKQKGTVVRHFKIAHSTEKPFKCPQENCNYSGKERHLLREHLKIHSDERAFPCSIKGCTHKSKRKGDLSKHMRIHTGERLFKCSFCPRAFADTSNLTTHTRIHTGELPYSCHRCPYRAKTSYAVIAHVRRMHSKNKSGKRKQKALPSRFGVFKCPVKSCGYSTKENCSLAVHLNNVHKLPKVLL